MTFLQILERLVQKPVQLLLVMGCFLKLKHRFQKGIGVKLIATYQATKQTLLLCKY